MSDSRSKSRRSPSRRAFRPTLDGRLEERLVLSMTLHQYLGISQGLLKHPLPRAAKNLNMPPFVASNAPKFNREFRTIRAAATQTIRGGQAVNVAAPDGSHYRIELAYVTNTIATAAGDGAGGTYTQTTQSPASGLAQPQSYPQPIGTVRVYAMPGGKVGIIVDGSTENTELTINPLPQPIRKGYAHSFAYGMSGREKVLNVGQITINSGRIGAIEGYHTADLSGPLVSGGTGTIDRIAFRSLQPGASIQTGGDVNTLDVLQGITLTTGTNIQIGRDLNLFNVGQDITLSNGSKILIGRDLGLVAQPAKGTGSGTNVLTLNFNLVGTTFVGTVPPPVSSFIQGNVTIDPGSVFAIGRSVDNQIYIAGTLTGGTRLIIPSTTVVPATNTVNALGGVIP